ncbi:MAG: 50S ribosomal protein L31 [Candidatus Hodgkinia cicadicola]
MKKNLHPKLYKLKVVCTDGTQFVTRSAAALAEIRLEVDTKTHPAWTKKRLAQDSFQSSGLRKYKDKYKELLEH